MRACRDCHIARSGAAAHVGKVLRPLVQLAGRLSSASRSFFVSKNCPARSVRYTANVEGVACDRDVREARGAIHDQVGASAILFATSGKKNRCGHQRQAWHQAAEDVSGHFAAALDPELFAYGCEKAHRGARFVRRENARPQSRIGKHADLLREH